MRFYPRIKAGSLAKGPGLDPSVPAGHGYGWCRAGAFGQAIEGEGVCFSW